MVRASPCAGLVTGAALGAEGPRPAAATEPTGSRATPSDSAVIAWAIAVLRPSARDPRLTACRRTPIR